MHRREFLAMTAGTIGGLYVKGCNLPQTGVSSSSKQPFKISLAQWSLHKRLFGEAEPKLGNLDFAETARKFGINAIEYVNQFFKNRAKDTEYLAEMKKRAEDNGVQSLLIMCDGEGDLGDPDANQRIKAVQNHYKWIEAAKFLGCHSIRVNAHSKGTYEQQMELAADGLSRLCEFAANHDIHVIVENHWGLSSDPSWATAVVKKVGHSNFGLLPDFGNFPETVDRYEAVKMMMPYAKAVSAKSYDFDEQGNETKIDYHRMMNIVLSVGYHGYVGIEYEGSRLSEDEGIIATKRLLEKIRQKLATT